MNQRIIVAMAVLLAAFGVTGCQETRLNPEWAQCMADACNPDCDPRSRSRCVASTLEPRDAILAAPSSMVVRTRDVGMSDGGDHADSGSDAGGDTGPAAVCVRHSDCGPSAPRCDNGTCGGCSSSLDCAAYGDSPACDTASGSCVECTASMQTHCTSPDQVCKQGGQECVECNSNAECSEAKPHCGADNKCDVCINDSDCTSFGKVCDSGQCVQCTGKKTSMCNGSVCDSAEPVCATGILPVRLSCASRASRMLNAERR